MKNWWDDDETVQPAPAQAGGYPPGAITVGRPKPKEAPTGYRYDAAGNLQAIPGGPADQGRPSLPVGYRMGPNGKAERIPGLPEDPNNPDPIKIPGDPTRHGDDYLKTVPDANLAAQIKAMSDGRMAPPTGRAASNPYWQRIIQMTAQYDPSFDQVNFGARAGTRKDFTYGKSAANIKSLNTSLGHLGTLSEQIAGTAGHSGFPFATTVNSVENSLYKGMGDPGVTNFDQTATALGSELTSVFRGNGGAEADVKRYIDQLSPDASAEQKNGAIRNIAALLKSRLDEIGNQYTQGMGKTTDPLKLLNPHAAKVMQTFGGGDDSGPPIVGAPPQGGGQPPHGPQGQPPVGPMDGPSSATYSLASGGYRNEMDQRTSSQVDQLIRRGTSPAEINNFLASKGFPPASNLEAAQEYLRRHPGYRGGFTQAMRAVPTTAMERISGSAPAAAVAGAANAVTAGFQDEAAGAASAAFGGDYTQARDSFDARKHLLAASHPVADLAGNVAGGVGATMGAEGLLGRFAPGAVGAAAKALGKYAPAATDAAYGAAYGAGENNDNRFGGAVGGGLTAMAGGAAARGLTKGVGNALSPTGGNAAALYELGARPTIGQRFANSGPLGKTINTVEQALQSVPGLGYAVNRARDIPRKQAQIGLFNDALSDIKQQLPKGMAPGTDPHAFANNAFTNAYNKARSGMRFAPDQEYLQKDLPSFMTSLRDGTLDGNQVKQVQSVILNAVGSRLKAGGGQMAGDQYKAAAAQLDRTAQAWSKNPNTALQASALRDYSAIFDNAARRNSSPKAIEALDNADRGYAKLVRIQSAAAMAGGDAGTFSPAQFRNSVQKNSGGVRSKAYNEGNALSQKYSDAMGLLQDTLPNSGSADRLFIGQLAGGSAAGSAAALGAPTAMLAKPGAALMLPYVPGANFLTTRAMTPRSELSLPPQTVAALEDMRKKLYGRAGLFGRLAAPAAVDWKYGQ